MASSSVNRTVSGPWACLLAQALLLTAALGFGGRFQPRRVNDTRSYERLPFDSVSAALSHSRTFGYPLFLRAADAFASEHQAAPVLHWLIHIAAVLYFYVAVAKLLRSRWQACWAASVLFYSNVTWRYGADLAADTLGSSASIVAIAALMTVVVRPTTMVWIGLTLATFASYQIRPAYLFLVPLLPALGLALQWVLIRCPLARTQPTRAAETVSAGSPARFAAILLAACVLPLFLFCTLRWQLVGQFSLVSFGGNNMIGVVGVFLDDGLVEELPRDLRPLAQTALARRARIAKSDPDYGSDVTLQYSEIERRFDTNTWPVFVEAARAVYGEEQPKINANLLALAVQVVKQRPRYYCVWLVKAAWRGINVMLLDLCENPVYLLLLFGLLLIFAVHGIRRLRLRPGAPLPASELAAVNFLGMSSLFCVAVSFAGAKLLLVILTSPPLGRFMDPGAIFLPVVAAIVLVQQSNRLRAQ